MARDSRKVPPTKLTRKWLDQDVNDIAEFEHHGVRMPNDYVDWNGLSGKVKKSQLTKEELDAYNAKTKK
jgi:hypothetical protein